MRNSTKVVSTILFLLTAIETKAQDITIGPKLRAGDEFRLDVTRIRENSSRPQQNGKSRTTVSVRVISATPQGYSLEWIPGETTIDNPQVAADPLIRAAGEAVKDMRFRLTLNSDGEFTGLANQAEVAPKLQSVADTIVRSVLSQIPVEQRKAFETVVGQILSPAALMSSATREVEIYFGMNGVELAVGETAEAPLQMASPIGGVIPATLRVQMESATPETAVLKTTTTYDAAALLRMTQALVQQAGAPIPPEELAKFPRMEMSDDARYVFDRTTGLMREVIVNRRAIVADMRRLDGWEIRLSTAPKR